MQFRLLPILLLFVTTHLFSQECPQPTGLFTDNYAFNSSYASVNANWESLLGTMFIILLLITEMWTLCSGII